MELIKQISLEQVQSELKERGYTLTAQSTKKEEIYHNFLKTYKNGIIISLEINIQKENGSLKTFLFNSDDKVQVDLITTLYKYDLKKIDKAEKLLYIYAQACLVSASKTTEPQKSISSIKDRKNEFWFQIKKAGKPDVAYEKCRKFYDYWTEMNPNGKKMRFEMEKIFDIKRRLSTWVQNDNKWDKNYIDKKIEKQNNEITQKKKLIDSKDLF